MANAAVVRNMATEQREAHHVFGQIQYQGPYGAPGSYLRAVNMTGSLPTILSGATPTQYTNQYTVQFVQSGSLTLGFAHTWPKLVDLQLTLGMSGSQGGRWFVEQDTGVPARSDTTGSSGANQVGIAIFNIPLTTGALGAPILAEPSGSTQAMTINVHAVFANAEV